jgi:hypothetical protein
MTSVSVWTMTTNNGDKTGTHAGTDERERTTHPFTELQSSAGSQSRGPFGYDA